MAKEIKFTIPKGADKTYCKGCGATIFWIITKKGKKMPVDPDGASHFATCSKAGKFRK